MTELTQWTPESMSAFERGDPLVLIAVGFEFIDAMLGSWPRRQQRRRPQTGEPEFLDSGWALFCSDPASLDWRALGEQVAKSMEAWQSTRPASRFAGRPRRNRVHAGIVLGAHAGFTEPAGGSPFAQTLEFATVGLGASDLGRKGRGSRAPLRKKKRSRALDRDRDFGGKPHRGDKNSDAQRARKLRRAGAERLWQTTQKVALAIGGDFLRKIEGVSAAQKVAPPSFSESRQWGRELNRQTQELEGSDNGLEAYRQFLLAQLRAQEITEAMRQAAAGGQSGASEGASAQGLPEPAARPARRI